MTKRIIEGNVSYDLYYGSAEVSINYTATFEDGKLVDISWDSIGYSDPAASMKELVTDDAMTEYAYLLRRQETETAHF